MCFDWTYSNYNCKHCECSVYVGRRVEAVKIIQMRHQVTSESLGINFYQSKFYFFIM
jgi:hypothetical protein